MKVECVNELWRVIILVFENDVFKYLTIKPIEEFQLYHRDGITTEERFNEYLEMAKPYLQVLTFDKIC